MDQIFAFALIFVLPIVCLLLYVYLSRKLNDVTLSDLLVMIVCAVVPIANIIVLVALLVHVYDCGDIFKKTIFTQKRN